jgi:hypothetical protein
VRQPIASEDCYNPHSRSSDSVIASACEKFLQCPAGLKPVTFCTEDRRLTTRLQAPLYVYITELLKNSTHSTKSSVCACACACPCACVCVCDGFPEQFIGCYSWSEARYKSVWPRPHTTTHVTDDDSFTNNSHRLLPPHKVASVSKGLPPQILTSNYTPTAVTRICHSN